MNNIIIHDFYKKIQDPNYLKIDNQNCLLRSMKFVFEFLSPYKLNYSLLFLAIEGNNYIFEPKENYLGIDIENLDNYKSAPFNIEIINKENIAKKELINKIKYNLKNNIPVIASVLNKELEHNNIRYSYHAITVYGLKNDDTLLFLDPTLRNENSIEHHIGEIKIEKVLKSHLILFLFSDVNNLYKISENYIEDGSFHKDLYYSLKNNKDYLNFKGISSIFKVFFNKKIMDISSESNIYSSCLEIFYKSKISGPIFYINLLKDLKINCIDLEKMNEQWEITLNKLLYLGQKNDSYLATQHLINLMNSFEDDFFNLYYLINHSLKHKYNFI